MGLIYNFIENNDSMLKHTWVANQRWDLIVTMDDATNEQYSMFFVIEEGPASSFRGVREVIEKHGFLISFNLIIHLFIITVVIFGFW